MTFETIKTFDLTRPVTVYINYHAPDASDPDNPYLYDWTADNGYESDILFTSAEEAEEDARSALG